MRVDHLARQWRMIREIEASPNELTVAEIDRPDGMQGTTRKRSPSKAYSKNWDGLFCYGGPKPIGCLILFKMAGPDRREE